MTEFEINKAVADKLGVTDDYTSFKPMILYSFDPCNNVEQAWEIMMKYNICVVKNMYDNYYDAYIDLNVTEYYTEYKYHQSHEKPLVLAMLCFLEISK